MWYVAHMTPFRRGSTLPFKLRSGGAAVLGLTSVAAPACSAHSGSPAPQAVSAAKDSSPGPVSPPGAIAWPSKYSAAVSLTYDDAIPSQRTYAAAQLNAHGLVGTFFLKGASEDLLGHRDAWSALLTTGNELGSHTMHHPCDRKFDWVPKGFATQDYDLPRMKAELEESIALLGQLGAKAPYTFAYPCGEQTVGENGESYTGLVSDAFLAARGFGSEPITSPSVTLENVPTQDGAQSLEELLALVDQAEATGSWLVLAFHGVGGDYLTVDLKVHDALLASLAERRETLWTATFGEVAAHIQSHR